MSILSEKKIVYLCEDNSSGCKYSFKNIEELTEKIEDYLRIYHYEELCERKEVKT